jgi:hypothetical protein
LTVLTGGVEERAAVHGRKGGCGKEVMEKNFLKRGKEGM